MTQDESSILATLDRLVYQPVALATIRQLAHSLTQQLQSKPAAAFVRTELPFSLFGADLPAEVQSSNIYVIRPGVSSGMERHPNSHQRSMALDGSGTFRLGLGETQRNYPLLAAEQSDVEARWVSIPPNTWHEALAGTGLWTVVTFHTAPDRAIINERI